MTLDYALVVNGVRHQVRTEARKLLLDVLREDCGLTGPHAGCEHGVCGACTVLLDGRSVRSCLLLGIQAARGEVTTIEGLARGDELHPLQDEFSKHHALQCGYCTPGMILTALELLRDTPSPTEGDVREALAGNLCRCTGYQPIVEAVLAAAPRLRERR
ncbi:MAG: (2Fe-2S)-binding protein [Chloroflexi bacterium]|nr:(2Fe-2S)-binding protein [Chloroflexota bacterium]